MKRPVNTLSPYRALGMPRRRLPALYILPSILVAACGGKPAESGGTSGAPPASTEGTSESIGEAARAQGGFTILGGGGTSGDGVSAASPLGPPLMARSVLPDAPVKLDGLLREWHALSAAKVESGKSRSKASFALQYDDNKVYIAGDIESASFARTSKFDPGEDHASLHLASPGPSGLRAVEIGLFAGKAGESAGVVRFLSGPRKGQDVQGAKIVEAPKKGGYTFEVALPWGELEDGNLHMGLRGALTYVTDGGKATVATGPVGSAKQLPELLTEPEIAVFEGLLKPKGLADAGPLFETFADVAGDGNKERIAIYGKYLTVCGPKYRDGKEFLFREFGGDALGLEARNVSGGPKTDLVVRRALSVEGSTHEVLEVWTFRGDEPNVTFAAQIAVTQGPRRVANTVRLKQGEIEVSLDKAQGWDRTSYHEPFVQDAEPVLVPWGSVKSRTYRFAQGKFGKVNEVTQKGEDAPGSAGAAPNKNVPNEPPPKDLPTPKVREGGDLSARVIEDFKRARELDAGLKPRADLQVNVSEDARPERVVLLGKNLVVAGPGYRGGNRYDYLQLDLFDDAADIREVTARDLNGDGRAEVLVRGVRRREAKGPSGAALKVESDLLLIYTVEEGFRRVFAIETSRAVGDQRVQGLVQFVPSGSSFAIDVRPGVAKGFTEKTYPWPEEPTGGALEPLLLPWSKVKSLRYTWNSGRFTLETR